ncbi:ABC transporter substrate-binding protein [Faunimonas pinastri]|nr:ABC transporter substrate-binding protein [Faunimonas pinastri]
MLKNGFLKSAGLSLAAAALSLSFAAAPAFAADDAIPAKPEAGTFKLGVEPWLGYGQWHVAAAKGLFKANGLDDVNVVNFTEDKDINAALASGQLDGATVATHTAMAMAAAGLPIKIVLLLDFSMDADAILAGKDVATVADLKGKKVAFEQGTTSDILLNYALQSAGLTIADVTPVPMPAADAGSALIAGQVPVAVTYEPYLTAARAQNADVKLLFTAGKDPGLISDVLVVRDEVAKAKPGQVLAMVKAWDAALSDYKANTKDDRAIIAKAVGSSAEDLSTAFDGVRYYSLAENRSALQGDYSKKTFVDVLDAAKKAGILTQDVAAKDLIDPRFVDAAK